jgi:hypothetical protein
MYNAFYMEQCPGKIAGIYRWPNPPDELWFFLSDILKRMSEPLPNGRSKRMFNIPETESVFLFATHLLMMDNNVTKYHQYPSRHSKVMDRNNAGIYRWPNPPDELWVSLSDILKRIPEPLPNGRSKRMFNIPETESVAIESKFGDWKTSVM